MQREQLQFLKKLVLLKRNCVHCTGTIEKGALKTEPYQSKAPACGEDNLLKREERVSLKEFLPENRPSKEMFAHTWPPRCEIQQIWQTWAAELVSKTDNI